MVLDPIERETLVGMVVVRLREAILSGAVAPGERLVEATLARQLGTSRGPIREALTHLEREGIVLGTPGKGRVVAAFDRGELDSIYGIRRLIEPYAVELVITSLDEESIAELESALDLMRDASVRGDIDLMSRRDMQFHATLYEQSGDRILDEIWKRSIEGRLQLLLNVTTATHVPLMDAYRNHRELADAVLARDVSGAKALITRHIEDAWARARKAFEGRFESASWGSEDRSDGTFQGGR